MLKFKEKILQWAQKDYYEPIYFKGTDLVDDLICFLNGSLNKKDFIVTESINEEVCPNIILVSGFINHKNIELLKLKYSRLSGKKILVTAGSMVNNSLNFPSYNHASLESEFKIADYHIYGPNPSREDIANMIIKISEEH